MTVKDVKIHIGKTSSGDIKKHLLLVQRQLHTAPGIKSKH